MTRRFRPQLPEEIAFFLRSAAYGIFIAIAYWFLTYEVAGTVLLAGFGGACAVLVALLFWRGPRRAAPGASGVASREPDGPFGDESGAVPAPTYAPLEIGVGLVLLILTIPFGPVMTLAAVVPLAAGSIGWLRAVETEPRFDGNRAVETGAADPPASPDHGPQILAPGRH